MIVDINITLLKKTVETIKYYANDTEITGAEYDILLHLKNKIDGGNNTNLKFDAKISNKNVFDFNDGNGPVPAHKHSNGGGWVADTASVADSAYVGPNTLVYGNAQVFDRAQVCDNARVYGDAHVYGDAQVYGDALVFNIVINK